MPVESVLSDISRVSLIDQTQIVHLVIQRLLLTGAGDDKRKVIDERAEVCEIAAVALELGEGGVELGRQAGLSGGLGKEAELRLMFAEEVAEDHLAAERRDLR